MKFWKRIFFTLAVFLMIGLPILVSSVSDTPTGNAWIIIYCLLVPSALLYTAYLYHERFMQKLAGKDHEASDLRLERLTKMLIKHCRSAVTKRVIWKQMKSEETLRLLSNESAPEVMRVLKEHSAYFSAYSGEIRDLQDLAWPGTEGKLEFAFQKLSMLPEDKFLASLTKLMSEDVVRATWLHGSRWVSSISRIVSASFCNLPIDAANRLIIQLRRASQDTDMIRTVATEFESDRMETFKNFQKILEVLQTEVNKAPAEAVIA